MLFPFFISKKYLTSKYASNYLSFISVISIIGIALGVAILIIALTILDGFEKAVETKIINMNSHIKITGFSNRNLANPEETESKIKKICGNKFVSVSPFIKKQAIIRSKKLSEGISITGIDATQDNSNLDSYILDGKFSFVHDSTMKGIIIGKKLANKLFVRLGDKVTIFTLYKDKIPSAENPPAIEQFYITAIFESGMSEYDDLNVYIDLNEARKLFGLNNSVSGYNVKLSDLSNIEQLVVKLQDNLRYPHYVRSIFKVHQNIFTWLDLQKEPIPIILGLIIIVAVFNIVGTLLLMVLERTKSIGILKTLGANKLQLIQIFLYQGLFISLIGILLGCFIALTLSYLQLNYNLFSLPETVYFLNSVPISISIGNYLVVGISAFALSILAALIPSYYASKVDPVTAIKFE